MSRCTGVPSKVDGYCMFLVLSGSLRKCVVGSNSAPAALAHYLLHLFPDHGLIKTHTYTPQFAL